MEYEKYMEQVFGIFLQYPKVQKVFGGNGKIYQFIVSDVKAKWYIDATTDVLKFEIGAFERPNMTLTSKSWQDWVDLLSGKLSAMGALSKKKIVVDGPVKEVLTFASLIGLMKKALKETEEVQSTQ